jgi:hypothetical protein
MRDERFPFRFEPFDIELRPAAHQSQWEGLYVSACGPSILVRWHRLEHEDSGCYEVLVCRRDGSISVMGDSHADNETAWANLVDAAHAWSPRLWHAIQDAERLTQAAKNERRRDAEEAVY